MLPYRDSRFTLIALVVFFLIAGGYAFYEARGMLFGPTIDVPAGVSEVHDPYVVIQGQANRISSLSMNGQPITVSEDGVFSQPYLLAPGYNRIILDAKDQYGRSRQRVIEIVYTSTSSPETAPQEATTTLFASSTPAMAPQMQ